MFFYKSDEYNPRKYLVTWVKEDDFGRWHNVGIVGFGSEQKTTATLLVLGEKAVVEVGDWVSFDEIDGVSMARYTQRNGGFNATLNIKIPEGKLRVYPRKKRVN